MAKETQEKKGKKKKLKKGDYPQKRTMNLYYKPDRTTVPATIALYVLFALSLLLAFGKFMVYDFLVRLEDKKAELARVQEEKLTYDEQLTGYDDLLLKYQLYSSTDDENSQTDRMDVLAMLDEIVRPYADMTSVSISEGTVNISISGVTLRQTAEIVRNLDNSPIVMQTIVDTAATVEADSAGAGRTEAPAAGGVSGVGSAFERIYEIVMNAKAEAEAQNRANAEADSDAENSAGAEAESNAENSAGAEAGSETENSAGAEGDSETENSAGAEESAADSLQENIPTGVTNGADREGIRVTANIMIALRKEYEAVLLQQQQEQAAQQQAELEGGE